MFFLFDCIFRQSLRNGFGTTNCNKFVILLWHTIFFQVTVVSNINDQEQLQVDRTKKLFFECFFAL